MDREETCRDSTSISVLAEQTAAKKKKKKKKKDHKEQPAVSHSPTTPTTKATPSIPATSATSTSLEEELEWCIVQLELGMLRPGASRAQKQQNQRSIQTLKGPKTPLPKKRQLMRSLFGDYRSKMRSQPLSESLMCREAKVEAAKPEVLETVGTYYRKSTTSNYQSTETHDQRQSDFKFDFTI